MHTNVGEGSYEVTAGDCSTERLIMQELEMKSGLEAMLAEQRMTAEKYKANFTLLEAQHMKLQSETQQLKDDLQGRETSISSHSKRYENRIYKLESERDQLLIEIEALKSRAMTPAKLENLRQNLLRDVETIYRQHLTQTEDEVEAYRKELNKLKFDHNFLKTEYENCQNEFAQKMEDLNAKYKLDLDTLQRKSGSMKKALEQKGVAAQESVLLMKENTKMTAKIKALVTENESFRKALSEEGRKADERVAKVSTQLSELHVKHELTANENKNLHARVEKLTDKLEAANTDLTKQIPALAKLEDQVMRLTSELEEVGQRHKMELAMAENEHKRQLSEVRREGDDYEAKLCDSKTQVDYMAKTIEQLKGSLRQREKELTEKVQGMQDQQWEAVNKAKEGQVSLEAKLAATERVHSERVHAQNIELEKLRNQKEMLASSVESVNKEKAALTAQIAKLQSTVECKDKDIGHYMRLEHEVSALQAQLKASSSQYKEEILENDKLKAQNKLANDEVVTLRSQISEMKSEFERICQTNQQSWEKENEALTEKYQTLKKRVGKGEKRREQILGLAKKQKNQYEKEISVLKDSVISAQAREKQHEMERESVRKNHELEVARLRRQIDGFKLKAAEFESLLYSPGVAVDNSHSQPPMPDAFTSLLVGAQQQQQELAEINKNLDDFQEKQADLEKVV